MQEVEKILKTRFASIELMQRIRHETHTSKVTDSLILSPSASALVHSSSPLSWCVSDNRGSRGRTGDDGTEDGT